MWRRNPTAALADLATAPAFAVAAPIRLSRTGLLPRTLSDLRASAPAAVAAGLATAAAAASILPVSYTHLTLPTICSV